MKNTKHSALAIDETRDLFDNLNDAMEGIENSLDDALVELETNDVMPALRKVKGVRTLKKLNRHIRAMLLAISGAAMCADDLRETCEEHEAEQVAREVRALDRRPKGKPLPKGKLVRAQRSNRDGNRQSYSFLKSIEGGPGLSWVAQHLRDEGIEFTPIHSPYVGHQAVMVYGNKKIQRKAEKIIFG